MNVPPSALRIKPELVATRGREGFAVVDLDERLQGRKRPLGHDIVSFVYRDQSQPEARRLAEILDGTDENPQGLEPRRSTVRVKRRRIGPSTDVRYAAGPAQPDIAEPIPFVALLDAPLRTPRNEFRSSPEARAAAQQRFVKALRNFDGGLPAPFGQVSQAASDATKDRNQAYHETLRSLDHGLPWSKQHPKRFVFSALSTADLLKQQRIDVARPQLEAPKPTTIAQSQPVPRRTIPKRPRSTPATLRVTLPGIFPAGILATSTFATAATAMILIDFVLQRHDAVRKTEDMAAWRRLGTINHPFDPPPARNNGELIAE